MEFAGRNGVDRRTRRNHSHRGQRGTPAARAGSPRPRARASAPVLGVLAVLFYALQLDALLGINRHQLSGEVQVRRIWIQHVRGGPTMSRAARVVWEEHGVRRDRLFTIFLPGVFERMWEVATEGQPVRDDGGALSPGDATPRWGPFPRD